RPLRAGRDRLDCSTRIRARLDPLRGSAAEDASVRLALRGRSADDDRCGSVRISLIVRRAPRPGCHAGWPAGKAWLFPIAIDVSVAQATFGLLSLSPAEAGAQADKSTTSQPPPPAKPPAQV